MSRGLQRYPLKEAGQEFWSFENGASFLRSRFLSVTVWHVPLSYVMLILPCSAGGGGTYSWIGVVRFSNLRGAYDSRMDEVDRPVFAATIRGATKWQWTEAPGGVSFNKCPEPLC